MADLEREQDRLRVLSLVFEQSTEGIAVTDLDGNLLFVNEAFAAMHGYSPAEIAGKHLSTFHTPEQQPSVEEANLQLQKTGEFSGEIWHARRDGTLFPGLMHNSILRNEEGKAVGMIGTLRDITELKEAEGALQESEKRFQQIAENAREWIWEVGTDGIYTYASPAVERILGYAPEEVVGEKHFYDLFHPEERELLKAKASAILSSEESFSGFINRNIHKNGDEIWLVSSGVPVFDGKGRPAGYRGVDIDITEIKHTQEALARSEERFRTIADFTYDWEYWISPKRHYLYVSPACERISGYSADEFIEDNGLLQKIVHPEDLSLFSQHLSDYCRTPHGNKGVGKIEFRIATRSGEERWIGHICQPVYREDGIYMGRRASNRDITERKKSQEKLSRYRNNLESMVEKRTEELKRANDGLLQGIAERTKIEKKLRESEGRLKEQKNSLEEKNIALREILEQLGVEKKKFKDDVVKNIENLVLPVLRKLETEEGQYKRDYLKILKRNLEELATSF
ncbi:MAG: PAS domain S-box protein, partial [Spirochaetota bacterium]|nr:PAS domain S-box protein [Spirochaetota bacterium]